MSNMEGLLAHAWEEYSKQALSGSALNATIEDLWHKIAQMEAPTPEEEDARLEICADLTERLASLGSSLGGTLEAEAHGSFLMGCYTSSSTLEVAVMGKLPGSGGSNALVDVELRSPADRLALLERLHSLIADCGIAAQGTVTLNRAARVPSVSFEHASSGIPVRLCIAYPNFALRPHVVRGLAMMEPRLRSLIQLVELWADARGLNNPAAGTFNSWALINLMIFAAQTFQPQPLLPPLWRVCGASDPGASGSTGAGLSLGGATAPTSTGGAAAPAGSNGGAAGPGVSNMAVGASSSTGGANPLAVRPTQRLSGLTSSSEGLAPVLKDIMARLTGPPEALGMAAASSPAAAQSSGAGLLPLFHWFLVLLDKLLAAWQLSWNRRWRVSTWWGQLVQQPFNRAFLVPVECPFDPADNAAKSLGCENQPRHQQVLRGVVAEVAGSLRLLQTSRAPQDLDRLILGMFGLEVEHLYLEEEEEEDGVEEGEVLEEVQESGVILAEVGDEAHPATEGEGKAELAALQASAPEEASAHIAGARPRLQQQHQQQAYGDGIAGAEGQDHNAVAGHAATSASGGAPSPAAQVAVGGMRNSSPVPQVRLLQAGEAVRPQKQRTDSPASAASPAEGAPRGSGGKVKAKSKAGAAAAAQRSRTSPGAAAAGAGAAPAVAGTKQTGAPQSGGGTSASGPGLGFDVEAVQVQAGLDDVDDGAAATAGAAAGSGGHGKGRRRQAAAAESPPLPTSSAAAVTAASPAVLRANAMVQKPLSPLLRDVTNARQYGTQSGPDPKVTNPSAASTSAASSAAASPGGESLLPFEGLFGSLLEGARRLFDNMAQGMAELGEDLNELAATTAATIRAVINDDEDLPFLGSSAAAAQRRQRRQRLQLLHRGGPGTAAAAAPGTSPASSSQQQPTPPSSSPAVRAAKASPASQQPRASPAHTPGAGGAVNGAPGTGKRVPASPGVPGRSPTSKAAAAASPAKPVAGKMASGSAASPAPTARKSAAAPAAGARGGTPARAVKRRGEQVAAALVSAAADDASLPVQPSPPSSSSQQQPPSVDAGALPGERKDNECASASVAVAVATAASPHDGHSSSAVAADESTTMAQASSPGPDADPDTTTARAAASGPPVRLQSVPVSASEHPLACSPLSALQPALQHGSEAAAATAAVKEELKEDPAQTAQAAAAADAPAAAPEAPPVASTGGGLAATPFAGAAAATAVAAAPGESADGGAAADPAVATIEAAPSAPSAVPLAVGLLRLGSLGTPAGEGCAASTCGTSLTRTSTPTADATASTASSPTVASSRSFAPTPPRKVAAGGGPQPPPALSRAATEPVPVSVPVGAAAAGGGVGAKRNAPPPPPPLPPPPRPPVGMGGLRVKSATFRKGAAREGMASITSPTGSSAASTPGSCASTTVTATTTATCTTTAAPSMPGPCQAPSVAVAAAAAAVARSFHNSTAVAAAAAAAAADASLQDPAARTVIQLGSGRLQELAECIDRAGPGTTIDLQGCIFAGTLAAPSMKVTAPGLWLINGVLELGPEQQLVFVAKGARMADVTIRDRDSGLAPAAGAAARPALLVTKQSYVGGGDLTLTRCKLLLGSGNRGIGVQVKGKGCSASLESCLVRGSALAAAQASDAALALTRCTLELGAGQGLCCRDNATVTATDCRLRCFGSACAAVLAGGSMELVGCKLSGERGGGEDGGDRKDSSGGGGGDDGPTAAEAADDVAAALTAAGPGVLAEGKGSSLVARGSSFEGFRSQAALVVTAGASASLEDCRAANSQQGALVGTRGGRLLAARCELSSHSEHGLSIGEGATADLRDCRLRANGAAGLRVGGVGSMAVLRGCELSGNAGSGVAVAAGGCANLDGCTASRNEAGAVHDEGGNGGRSELAEGHGLHVEGSGARVTALRCAFSSNAGTGIKVGAHGSVQLLGCGMHRNGRNSPADPAPPGSEGPAMRGPASEAEVGGVEVEVEAHGRVSLSKGCSWGRTSSGDDGEGAVPGGPDIALRVAESGCLERLDNA